jgi:hypothetical protein
VAVFGHQRQAASGHHPQAGVGGTGSASGSISFATSSTSYGAPALDFTIRAAAGGTAALNASATFGVGTPDVSLNGAGKWIWRPVGGSFADVAGGEGFSSSAAFDDGEGNQTFGSLSVSRTHSGMTPGTDYQFQFLLRSTQAGVTATYAGSGSAVAS